MKLGKVKTLIFIFVFIFFGSLSILAEDKIESVPLINLEELSPTFEEDKNELEKVEENSENLDKNQDIPKESKTEKNNKIYINLKALDKITAKTSEIKLAVGEKKFFGTLETLSPCDIQTLASLFFIHFFGKISECVFNLILANPYSLFKDLLIFPPSIFDNN